MSLAVLSVSGPASNNSSKNEVAPNILNNKDAMVHELFPFSIPLIPPIILSGIG